MPARTTAALLVAAVVVVVAVPSLLVWRLSRTDPLIDAAPPRAASAPHELVVRGASRGRARLATPRFPDVRGARVAVSAVVGTADPTVRFRLEPRDARGRALASCRLTPSDYRVDDVRQSALLACPVSRASRVRTLEVAAAGANGPVKLRGIRLVRPADRAPLARLGAARPALLGGHVFVAALALSLALALAAVLAAARHP